MKAVYLLLPLFATEQQKNIVLQIVFQEKQVESILLIPSQQFKIINVDNIYCVQVAHFNLSFTQIQSVFKDYQQTKKRLCLFEDAIQDFNLKDMRKVEASGGDIDSLMKKVKKLKQVKQENKKLKKLLQIQCENAQKVRQQTQKTIKTLREQFDELIKQMHEKDIRDRKESTEHKQIFSRGTKDKERKPRKEQMQY